ncbi:uncharacterized protein LOC133327733 [Musca vetustissima]|uniref:uncharacterized protein LOC133327733 n=1 Tax=Musca vetustissima TaxID=27455 RepID=UPI002AB779E0|nr:uncharacterized protein LOC133327733 [Musca vetustissima]
MMKFILVFIIIICIKDAQPNLINQVIDKIQKELDIYTLLLFVNQETFDVLESPNLPQLVIGGNETAKDLRRSQGQRVLSFIRLDVFGLEDLNEFIKPSLFNLHLADVLFYTNSTELEEDEWHWLFQWCWTEGFWRVLLMNAAEMYLTMDSIPEMNIKSVNLNDYIVMRKNRVVNLQGYPVKVAVGSKPPRVNAFFDEEGNLQLGGYYGHIVSMFISRFNATMDYVIMPNMSSYSILSCIESILEQTSDICSDAILFGNGIETTRPLHVVSSHLVVPFDKPLENYNYFRKPFTIDVWICIAISFISTIVLLILIEYKEYGQLRLVNSIFTTFSSLICASFSVEHLPPIYHYGVETILIFSGFMISNYYLAVLSALLLTKIYEREIESIQDVLDHNLTIVTTEFQQYVLEVTKAPDRIRQQTVVFTEEEAVRNMQLLNTDYVYFGINAETDFFLYQQKYLSRPRMKKLEDEAVTTDIGEIPMRAYWPLQDLLMSHMENIFASGITMYLETETFEEGIRQGDISFIPNRDLYVEPLSLEYFVLCGLLLAGGYSISFLCFIIEIVVNKYRGRK